MIEFAIGYVIFSICIAAICLAIAWEAPDQGRITIGALFFAPIFAMAIVIVSLAAILRKVGKLAMRRA